jgi:hypothetical protein
MIRRTPDGVRIRTRHGFGWTDGFGWIIEATGKLRAARRVAGDLHKRSSQIGRNAPRRAELLG